MSTETERNIAALERLSALVDGELDGAAVAQTCGQWRQSAEVRSTWHAYHLIGDVLRSNDLATDPARDTQFLAALRARLNAEPVVLAPRPLESAGAVPAPVDAVRNPRRGAWLLPAAVAAGFVAAAGVLMVDRGPGAPTDASAGPELARLAPQQSVPATPLVQNASNTLPAPVAIATEPPVVAANGQLVRDARLDRYLAAHKQFADSSALGVPSGFLRNATAIEADR